MAQVEPSSGGVKGPGVRQVSALMLGASCLIEICKAQRGTAPSAAAGGDPAAAAVGADA